MSEPIATPQPTKASLAGQPAEASRAEQLATASTAGQPTEASTAGQPTEASTAGQPTEASRAGQPAEASTAGQPLVRIVTGDAPHGSSGKDALTVRVGPGGPADGAEARIAVRIADPALAATITERIAAALAAAAEELAATAPQEDERAITLRSRKALARRAAEVAGALAVVPVTERNARHLVELVGGIRTAGALGVQLVWDGEAPPRERIERHVFAVLEHARATPHGPPVVLAAEARTVAALRILIAHGRRTER